MSEAKFTTGPWFVDEEYLENDLLRLTGSDGHGILHGELFTEVEIESKADGYLIASAPELYDALKSCLNFMENTESELGFSLESADQARAALAKARGEGY